jgi:hypothetical protein
LESLDNSESDDDLDEPDHRSRHDSDRARNQSPLESLDNAESDDDLDADSEGANNVGRGTLRHVVE